MKRVVILILAGLLLAGCKSDETDISGLNSAEIAYVEWYETLQTGLKENSDYQQPPFETAKQKEQFDALLREAYQGKVDRREFVDRLTTAFPDYEKSAELIAEYLPE